MNSQFAVRPMRPGELELVLEWARQEGWNPGLDDSLAFHGADPSGFFVGALGEVPVGSISMVKYGDEFAFLGLYIVHPDFRGKGYGRAIWNAGMASAEGRVIGLDGVEAQQQNYRKAGFEPAYKTIRFGGIAKTVPSSASLVQAVTDRTELMVAVRPNFHHPALFAKAAANIDRISNGTAIMSDADLAWTRLKRAITNPRAFDMMALGVGARSVDFGRAESVYVLKQSGAPDLARRLSAVKSQLWREGAIARDFPFLKAALLPALEMVHIVRGVSARLK